MGRRGGIDKRCQVKVVLRGLPSVYVDERDVRCRRRWTELSPGLTTQFVRPCSDAERGRSSAATTLMVSN